MAGCMWTEGRCWHHLLAWWLVRRGSEGGPWWWVYSKLLVWHICICCPTISTCDRCDYDLKNQVWTWTRGSETLMGKIIGFYCHIKPESGPKPPVHWIRTQTGPEPQGPGLNPEVWVQVQAQSAQTHTKPDHRQCTTVTDNQSRQNPIKEEPKLLGPNRLQIQIQWPRKRQKNNIWSFSHEKWESTKISTQIVAYIWAILGYPVRLKVYLAIKNMPCIIFWYIAVIWGWFGADSVKHGYLGWLVSIFCTFFPMWMAP